MENNIFGDLGRRWYIVQTYSGYENAVKQDILRRTETMGFKDLIFQVIVPEEVEITKKTNGSEKRKVKQIFPGYVFVEMIVTDDSWFMVRNTPKVTGFLGSRGGGTKPVPLKDEEIKAVLLKMGAIAKPVYDYLVGQTVEVISGSFKGHKAVVDRVDNEKEMVVVGITLFGQTTPLELSIRDIKQNKEILKENKE